MRHLPRPSCTTLGIATLALALYLPGFWWGIPHATAPDRTHGWGVDDTTPLGALAEIHNLRKVVSNRNLGYPLLHPFAVAGVASPYLGYLWVTGGIGAPSATFPFGLADPVGAVRVLGLLAHLLSVLMGVGIVLAVYDAGRRLWDARIGLWAAGFAALAFPMFYYTRTGNVDVPVLFFIALALNAFARILVGGFTLRRAVGLGAAVGFALATKEPAFASFVALPPLLVTLHWWRRRGIDPPRSWAFWKQPVAAMVVAVLSFGVGSGWFVDPGRFFAHLAFASGRVRDLAEGDIAFVATYPYTLEGHLALARLILGYLADAMTLPGVLLALAGVVWVARREPLKAAFALPAITYIVILFWSARAAQLRYLMPAALTLAFFAAAAVGYAWQSRRRELRAAFATLGAGILALSLLRGVDLTHAMINDSRHAAGAWLAERTEAGDRIEYFGASQQLPPLEAGVATTRAIAYRGAVHQPRIGPDAVAEIAAGWRQRRPHFIIIMPDHSSTPGSATSASCPPEVYEALLNGSLGYRLASKFETPSLLPWVGRPALDYPAVNPPIRIFVPARAEVSS